MNKVLILGAFDRYNYGDLLFPLIIEKVLKDLNKETQIRFFGIIDKDLSSVGGVSTQSIKSFYKECNDSDVKVNIIIAGGDSLTATWSSLLASLNRFFEITHRYRNIISNIVNVNFLAKRFIGGKTKYPFIIEKNKFKQINKILFNSLGGSGVNDNFINNNSALFEVDYFAVRDIDTYNNLNNNGINIELFPDSAILMSKLYPLETELKSKTSAKIIEFVRNNENYIFFQVNQLYCGKDYNTIIKSLKIIGAEFNLKICLCPIGSALSHNDQIPLERISKKLDIPHHYFEDVTIWDIMYLIAKSKCYIGTSLHGTITAMSFDIPYIGLKAKKLNSYLKSWGVENINYAIDFNQIPERFRIAVKIPKEQLVISRINQIDRAELSFQNIYQLIK
ncbi:polysaccharide pyruvyl transferase family protein [Pontibacter sp. H259]|uniref:polysaccharide pyruvyl transferase family protein n=1 Tax=Pontibacter sp. H259 TaxID=3133421 RepID=UPI0030C20282